MFDLPGEKIKAERVNAKKIILFSNPKAGKSTAVAALDNNLILDLEGGTSFIDAMKVDVLKIARESQQTPLTVLKETINKIAEANAKKGGFVYRYITVDTVSALEDIALELANKLYKNTPMGRNWVGDDVTKLPNGAGILMPVLG